MKALSERTGFKRKHKERQEARKSNEFRGSKKLGITIIVCSGLSALPLPASAAARTAHAAASRMEAGTLPLFAALGIGIFVAVIAVIAFLQMTGRDKELRGPYTVKDAKPEAESEPDGPEEEEAQAESWDDEETSADDNYDEHPLTDYTIPVTRILEYPEQMEPASENEPRLRGLGGEHAGSSYRIANRRLTFGRDPAHCSVLYPFEAGEISRVHCTLKFNEDSRVFVLEDNGSSNGTFLGSGERLEPGVSRELRAGDRFSLSGTAQLFEVLD